MLPLLALVGGLPTTIRNVNIFVPLLVADQQLLPMLVCRYWCYHHHQIILLMVKTPQCYIPLGRFWCYHQQQIILLMVKTPQCYISLGRCWCYHQHQIILLMVKTPQCYISLKLSMKKNIFCYNHYVLFKK